MGLFFRNATEIENKNYKKGMEVGYLAAILLLVINNFYHVIYNKDLLTTILISILAIPWLYMWFLSFKAKSKNNRPK